MLSARLGRLVMGVPVLLSEVAILPAIRQIGNEQTERPWRAIGWRRFRPVLWARAGWPLPCSLILAKLLRCARRCCSVSIMRHGSRSHFRLASTWALYWQDAGTRHGGRACFNSVSDVSNGIRNLTSMDVSSTLPAIWHFGNLAMRQAKPGMRTAAVGLAARCTDG